MHLEMDLPNPMMGNFHLSSVLRGMRRKLGDSSQSKHPITPNDLKAIRSQLDQHSPIDLQVWAIALVLFFGLLRKASVLPTASTVHDTSRILTRDDVTFHQWGAMLTVRTTKTIQFQERALQIPLPRMQGHMFCPVNALLRAFAVTPRTPPGAPAFLIPAKPKPIPVSGRLFVSRVKELLTRAGMDTAQISGHSFRRGGATWAYTVGLPAETIRALGDSVYCLPPVH